MLLGSGWRVDDDCSLHFDESEGSYGQASETVRAEHSAIAQSVDSHYIGS
jgi:hypothetical protein